MGILSIATVNPEIAAKPEAKPVVEEKPAVKAEPKEKKPAAPTPAILTPKKPFKIADLIEQQMAEMEDLEKEMIQEVDKRRGETEARQTPSNR